MRMVGKVESFLEAYEDDLNYHRNNGIESLNHYTSGTPYFDTDAAEDEYMADLRTTIELVRSN